MKRWFALILALVMLLCAMPAVTSVSGSAKAESYQASVVGGWLRLRAAPSFEAATITSCYTGTRVTVLSKDSANWCHVRVNTSGLEGYMYGAYLKSSSSGGGSGTKAYVVSTNGKGVRLRSGPGTVYSVIGLYKVGTAVTILKSGTNWCYIKAGSQYGYMMSQFLAVSPSPVMPTPTAKPTVKPTATPTAKPVSYTAYVTSTNGYGVRMRSGPGSVFGIIGFYSVGTQITVVQYGTTWCRILVNGQYGYMMTKYITASAPSVSLLSVSMSNYKPRVGDVISVNISPSQATVSYAWYDNATGGVIGTGSTLTVTADMAGRCLCVAVTGTGSYSGRVQSSWSQAVEASVEPVILLKKVTISSDTPTVGTKLRAKLGPQAAEAEITWYNSKGEVLGTGKTYKVKKKDIGLGIYCVAVGTGSTTGTCTSAVTQPVQAAQAEAAPEAEDTEEPTDHPESTAQPVPTPTATGVPATSTDL